MGHTTCCIKTCHKNGKNTTYKFFSFPSAKKHPGQRAEWIKIVRKVNGSDLNWEPLRHHYICESHFVDGKKSRDPLSPAYVPCIFENMSLPKKTSKVAALKRYNRLMSRREHLKKDKNVPTIDLFHPLHDHNYLNHTVYAGGSRAVQDDPAPPLDRMDYSGYTADTSEPSSSNSIQLVNQSSATESYSSNPDTSLEDSMINSLNSLKLVDEQCQVYTDLNPTKAIESYTCIKYYLPSGKIDVEIQTDIQEPSGVVKIKNTRQFKDKQCGTPQVKHADACVGPSDPYEEEKPKGFLGVPSIKSKDEYLALAGVTEKNFQFLLKQVTHSDKSRVITKENKLLMFLMKIKCGLSFTAIGSIFNVHRSWVSKLFSSVLDELVQATRNLIFWPSREVVRATMPSCFLPDYENVRVIIDCTEFRLECPASVENRVLSYSNYKKGFTARALIGITPSGFICFKSPLAGGRKSDSQITVESGFLNLLENGDVVLADKGFPSIQTKINEQGKEVMVVMPPFLSKNNAFTKEETEKTYSVARVRIHVERIMQRIRIYKIMDKIPANLFKSADKIFEMCCILTNLQPPIFDEKKQTNPEDPGDPEEEI